VQTASPTAVGQARLARRLPMRAPLVQPGRQLLVLFALVPLWWLLGASMFIWPALAGVLVYATVRRGSVRMPRRFGIWLLFILWMLAGGAELQSGQRILAFAWRGSLYLTATIVFLYVYNCPRRLLPNRAIVNALALYWSMIFVAGWLGVLFPHVAFATPVDHLLPAAARHNAYVHAHVFDQFAQVQRFTGYPHGRPTALFAYTNEWGSMFAITTPFAIAAAFRTAPRRWQTALRWALGLSIVPIVWSLDRGLWLSLGVGLFYAAFRVTGGSAARRLVVPGVACLALAAAIFAIGPFHKLVADRFSHKTGDAGRLVRDQEAVSRTADNPLIGHGAPLPSSDPSLSNVGTESQIFLVLFSNGVVGLFLFLTWFAYALARSARAESPEAFWAHVSVLIACVQLPVYEVTERLPVLFIGVALIFRELDRPGAIGDGQEPGR
jgi:hypothetical protein